MNAVLPRKEVRPWHSSPRSLRAALVWTGVVAWLGMVASFADTFTVTTNANNGAGSLRRAILDANATRGADVIAFRLAGPGPHSIDLLSPLPAITDPVLIDGATQPGYAGLPLIELNGAGAGPAADGLWITVGNSSVRGLAINRFNGHGLRLESGDHNQVVGNFIGTDATGTNAWGNTAGGILVLDSNGNNLGGPEAETRNLISGNGGHGVAILSAHDNVIQGNFIGTDLTGSTLLPNRGAGVWLSNAVANTLGGGGDGAGNVISGNDTGVELVDSSHNVVHGNVISGNTQFGIRIGGPEAAGNVVAANFIGTDVSGSFAIPNGQAGISIQHAPMNSVGGVDLASRNLISGNGGDGLQILGADATNNVVQGNFVGTDAGGTNALGNRHDGVLVQAPNTTIGGTEAGAGNVVSGNWVGIRLQGATATGNVVQGNLVGTDATGRERIGRKMVTSAGILLVDAPANTVGGTEPGAGNVISGNGDVAIGLEGSNAVDNVIQGNLLGTDKTGLRAVPNAENGVSVGPGADRTLIGGTEVGAGNLIAGNQDAGIELGSAGSQVMGNLIGTDKTGNQPLPNHGPGIAIRARDNWIGGSSPAAGNRIAFNHGAGVLVGDGFAIGDAMSGNSILGNAIFANQGLGINLLAAGENGNTVTPNDPLDTDSGPNRLQNFPVLTNVTLNGSTARVRGTLNSTPERSFSIDFYANSRTEPSGPAEGERYLGFTTCTTDSQGRGSFLFTVSGAVSNQSVTATATDLDTGDTSEFSAAAGGVRLVSVERSGADLRLSFTTWLGLTHRLEYATTLGASAVWSAVPGASDVAGTGGVVTRTDSGAASAGTRFYRVRVVL